MIDEWAEPDTTEEIQNQIDSSERSCHEDRVCFEIEPESDRKPDEHIRESCYCGVDEDVGEEGRRFHNVFLVPVIARHEAIQSICRFWLYPSLRTKKAIQSLYCSCLFLSLRRRK